MAFYGINFNKYSANSIIIRSIRYLLFEQKCSQFSTSRILNNITNKDAPVKFLKHKAAQVPISEIIGVEPKKSSRLPYEKYVVLGSIAAFCIYFFVLREENDIDEILKGNSDYQSTMTKLVLLKTQLTYCETNHLPTAKLKAKIEELEVALKGNTVMKK